jgi:hypothetical protein
MVFFPMLTLSQGDGKCIRMNMDRSQANFPVENVMSSDMVCGE